MKYSSYKSSTTSSVKAKFDSLFDRLDAAHAAVLSQAVEAFPSQKELCSSPISPSIRINDPGKHGKWRAGGRKPEFELEEERQRREARRLRFLTDTIVDRSERDGGGEVTEALAVAREEKGEDVTGTSENLEKEYLRLTKLPRIEEVRPPEVLAKALEVVKMKWRSGEEYKRVCDMLKSIRQDLTVQHVKNALSIEVYETHARIAIEIGDWGEARQCLAVLQGLYSHVISDHGLEETYVFAGSSMNDREPNAKMKENKRKDRNEFQDRGMLQQSCVEAVNEASAALLPKHTGEFVGYLLVLAAATGKDVLAYELRTVSPLLQVLKNNCTMMCHVKCAIDICWCYGTDNMIGLINHYQREESSKSMQPYLLDILVGRLRPKIWERISLVYRSGTIPLSDIAHMLGYHSEQDAYKWIVAHGMRVNEDKTIGFNQSIKP